MFSSRTSHACRFLVPALVLAAPLSAQTDSVTTWPIGSRVRVWTTPDRKLVGYLEEVRGDTLLIVAPGAERVQKKMLADSALRLEVSDGRLPSPKNIAGGAFIGAALALATVAILNASSEAHCTVDGGCGGDPDYGDVALIGAGIGAVAGAFKLEDRWRAVRIPGRVSLVPRLRHTAITLSFAFR